jgi:16S rRNA processing protein RimM
MELVIGRVSRAHGLRGELTVEIHTDDPDLRFAAGQVLATEPAGRGPLTVAASRWHSGRLLVAFTGYSDRTAAEGLQGTTLLVDSADLEDPDDPDEFRDHQLVGLGAWTVGGEQVGVVDRVLHHGQDLLVIRRPGQDEIMVPFVAAIVPEVDVAGGRLVIDPPGGLLDPA